ncbi:MAG: hypothetical protein ACO3RB_01085 [Ilumatobacteraceae bacterium]
MPRLVTSTLAAVALSLAFSTDVLASPPDTDAPVTESTVVWDLERDPSECIGFLPKPGCGKEPEQAGDRGGVLQWTIFGLILGGVGTVGTVLARNVIRRDREIARRLGSE